MPRLIVSKLERAISWQERARSPAFGNVLTTPLARSRHCQSSSWRTSRLPYQDRLVSLEKKLARAEEAAAERAKSMLIPVNDFFSASIKDPIKSFLSTEGPDVANIIDIRKFETMKAWLDNENVLLLRSPPGSGKTTALSFAAHLHSKGFKVTYLNASLAQSAVSDTKSMDDVWQDAFDSDSTFSDMCTTPSEEDRYI